MKMNIINNKQLVSDHSLLSHSCSLLRWNREKRKK